MAKATQKRRGRPPKEEWATRQIAIRLPMPLLVTIDEMREGRLNRLERTAMIRELLVEAIEAREAKKAR